MGKVKLKYDYNMYNPAVIGTALTRKEAEKEYERLAKIANKRLQAMAKTKYRKSDVYRYNQGKYISLSEMEKASELYYKLSDLARFITAERGTVAGLRRSEKRAIETLHMHGYDFVNAKNFDKFYEFMEITRVSSNAHKYDSERVAELFELAERKKLPPEELAKDFTFWMDHAKQLEKLENIPKRKNARTSAEYRKRIKRLTQ